MPPGPLAAPEPWQLVADGYAAEMHFVMRPFSLRAIEVLALGSTARAIDVAAGPGTLALELAKSVARVDAVDFAERMVEELQRVRRERGIENVFPIVGDGQALPFADASFDGAFSMFGLMFFPDRPQGYRELFRVLKPGGKALVSSWAAVSDSPLMTLMFGAVHAIDSSVPMPQKDPLGLENPDVLAGELRQAGFVDVEIVPHSLTFSGLKAAELWPRLTRSSAPLVLLRRHLGEATWAEREPLALAYLERELATPRELGTTAWLGVGTKPPTV